MKTLKLMFVALSMICLAACSGPSYDAATCDKLAERIDAQEQLTDSDYSVMIDQMSAIADDFDKADKKDKADAIAYFSNEENAKKLGHAMIFSFYLDAHQSELSADNLKKYQKLQDRFDD